MYEIHNFENINTELVFLSANLCIPVNRKQNDCVVYRTIQHGSDIPDGRLSVVHLDSQPVEQDPMRHTHLVSFYAMILIISDL